MASEPAPRTRRYMIGDVVRFKEGRQIDWEVIGVLFPQRLGEAQQLTLESGMTGRVIRAGADKVVPRPQTAPYARNGAGQ